MRKLKRLPEGMDYDEIRLLQAEPVEPARPNDPAAPDTVPEIGIVASPELGKGREVTPEPQSMSPKTEPGEADLPTEEPQPALAGSAGADDLRVERKDVENASEPVKNPNRTVRAQPASVPDSHDTPQADNAISGSSPQTVQIRGRFSHPAEGVSAVYDEIANIYDAKTAMKHLISLALKDYQAALIGSDGTAPDNDPDYAMTTMKTQGSRTFSFDAYQIALERLDPKGILPKWNSDAKMIQSALNRFIARENVGSGRPRRS